MSSQSLYNENKSEPYMTLHDIEPRNPLEMMQAYNPEGEQHIKQFLKEQEGNTGKIDQNHLSFWTQSPKNLTPFGFSPSPFSLNMNNSYNYYFNNFNMELQRQTSKDEENH